MENVHLIDGNGNIGANATNYVMQRMIHIANTRKSRVDASGVVRYDTHDLCLRESEAYFKGLVVQAGRADAVAGIGGGNGPRDLTHRMRTILEEKRPPLTSLQVFPLNTEVPPGARDYEVRRRYYSGEAVVYRGGNGSDIPTVGVGMARFRAPVHYFVSKVAIDLLEQWSGNMLGVDEFPGKLRHAIRVIEEKENQYTWHGNADLNLLGLLNHPYVDTAFSAIAYVAASTATDIAADIAYWANYAHDIGQGAFQSDTWLIAPELDTYLRNRPMSTNSDKSVMTWILDANPSIKKVIRVRELSNAQGAGIHAMAFVRTGMGADDASAEIIKPMSPTVLPPEISALGQLHYLISGFGGLNQKTAGDNVIVYVQGGN